MRALKFTLFMGPLPSLPPLPSIPPFLSRYLPFTFPPVTHLRSRPVFEPVSDHVAKFHGDRPRELGEGENLAKKTSGAK